VRLAQRAHLCARAGLLQRSRVGARRELRLAPPPLRVRARLEQRRAEPLPFGGLGARVV
jgi:hypothetical protein